MTADRPAILAVDGGNSKTDVALVDRDGRVLSFARGGGFRPQTEGVAAAVDVIEGLLTGPGPYAHHIAAYVAGADLPAEEEAIRAELVRRGFGDDVVAGNDTFALLRAGAPAGWGVAVVCGAGINCVGVSSSGEVARFPALGRVSGDWGGGQGLAEEMLWHAIRGEDGRGPETELTAAIREFFGTGSVLDVSTGLHFGEIAPERLWQVTPRLFTVAAAGDEIAAGLVDRLAEEVAILGGLALRRIGLLDTPAPVVLGGGVLTARDPALMAAIGDRYARLAPKAELIVTDPPPITGAVLLGLDHIGAGAEACARAVPEVRRALDAASKP